MKGNKSNITVKLLKDLKNGDKKAFEKIYAQYYNPILLFLNSWVHPSSSAEDLCQELFSNLWENRETINPKKNLKSYLFTSARNKAVDFYRKKKEINFENDIPSNLTEENLPDDMLIATDTWLQIIDTVKNMPKQRQRVFKLSRFEKFSNEEISLRLNITKNAVEKHITFALRDIRTTLKTSNEGTIIPA
ncbi:RNA polymerase sigma-70 factor [Bacteroides sp. OttesenSCG-928-N06]|nr:RNA polymerase sigma-70 factor [Bacteroides sp. OttesenSCG-928-N06]